MGQQAHHRMCRDYSVVSARIDSGCGQLWQPRARCLASVQTSVVIVDERTTRRLWLVHRRQPQQSPPPSDVCQKLADVCHMLAGNCPLSASTVL